jgi:hypothetical protein
MNLFVMYATCILLLAHVGRSSWSFDMYFRQLPGGREGIPQLTHMVLGAARWISTWWPVCILLGAGLSFGVPVLLRRSPQGVRLLDRAARWMSNYHATVLVLFVAGMFTTYWVVDLALRLPFLQIIEQLTSR